MKDDRLYLVHMRECMDRVIDYTSDGRERFMQSTLIQDAVLRNLQTMSESSQRLSETLRDAHPEVDWRGLSGFRNILVHDYLGVDMNTVWQLVQEELPKLKRRVGTILARLDDSGE